MIDIIIDGLTDCLVDRKTGQKVKTKIVIRDKKFTNTEISSMHKLGWNKNFNWKKVQEEGCVIAELYVVDDSRVQGYIGFKHMARDLYTFVNLVESAPWNLGHNGKYIGVGGHLFAIACNESFKNSFDGFVMFESKTDLVEHYKNELGANVMSYSVPPKMVIETKASLRLVNMYFEE